MITSWPMQRSMRYFLAGAALFSGFILTKLLIHQSNFTLITGVFSTGLAALVGVGKLASP